MSLLYSRRSKLYARLHRLRMQGRLEDLLAEHRNSTAGLATGKVLEIGPGTGANLQYYNDLVSVTLLDVNPFMIDCLVDRLHLFDSLAFIIQGKAESLPFKDNVFDSVVVTLSLASVSNLNLTLLEILRVMKCDASFYFFEHVSANSKMGRLLQLVCGKLWNFITCGDNLNRDISGAIQSIGFSDVQLKDIVIEGALPFARNGVIGLARR